MTYAPKQRLITISTLGILIALLLTGLTLQYEVGLVKKTFSEKTGKMADELKHQFDKINNIDDKLSFLFQVSDHVLDEDFSLQSRSIFPRAPYIKKIIYAPQIRNSHIKSEEEKLQYAGYTGLNFRPFLQSESARSPFSDIIFPVKYIQPYTPYTSLWFGRDIMTYLPVQDMLHSLILEGKKLQISVIKNSPSELYLFSTVTFLNSDNKNNSKNAVSTEDIFGVLGYLIDLNQWLLPVIKNLNIATIATLNNQQFFAQGKLSENNVINITRTELIDFEGQIINLDFHLSKPLTLIDYRIPLLILALSLLLTRLIFFIEKNHIERNKILNEQNSYIEKKVSEKTALLKERTSQLNTAYTHQLAVTRELESFSYSISHDLRAPLRSISTFSQVLKEEYSHLLDDEAKNMLLRVQKNAQRMNLLIDDLLSLAKVSRQTFVYERFSISKLANEQIQNLIERTPTHPFKANITQNLSAKGDIRLMGIALNNLLGNAIKYSSKSEAPSIEFGLTSINAVDVYFVRDNGVGFDMRYADKLFSPFQRLHGDEFEGTGVGLATVQRIINRHSGKIWAESEPGKGTCFYFTLGEDHPPGVGKK